MFVKRKKISYLSSNRLKNFLAMAGKTNYGELGGSAIGRSWPNLSFSPFTVHLFCRNGMSSSKDPEYGASRLQRVPTSLSLKSIRGQTPPVRGFHQAAPTPLRSTFWCILNLEKWNEVVQVYTIIEVTQAQSVFDTWNLLEETLLNIDQLINENSCFRHVLLSECLRGTAIRLEEILLLEQIECLLHWILINADIFKSVGRMKG